MNMVLINNINNDNIIKRNNFHTRNINRANIKRNIKKSKTSKNKKIKRVKKIMEYIDDEINSLTYNLAI